MAERSQKLPAGTPVRILPGTPMPEFPDIVIGGLTATVLESRGRGAQLKYFLGWTDASKAAMPADFEPRCVERQLAADMVCLMATDVEVLSEGEDVVRDAGERD